MRPSTNPVSVFPVIGMACAFGAGIVLYKAAHLPLEVTAMVLLLAIAACSIAYVLLQKSGIKELYFDVAICFCFIAIGYFNAFIHDEAQNPNHYLQHLKANKVVTVRGEVLEILKPTQSYNRYVLKVNKLDSISVFGKLLLSSPKSLGIESPCVDDRLMCRAVISELISAKNPHQFDYQKYLNQKGIYRQLYLNQTNFSIQPSKTASIRGMAEKIRLTVSSSLQKQHVSGDVLAITQALVLGYKYDISKEVYQNFVDSGVVHIFALSGLHIAMVYGILCFILRPLVYIKRKVLQVPLALLILWLYAMLVGFSPSVARAVVMVTVYAFANYINRDGNNYNILFTALFLNLLFEPSGLFEVGFQMSYTAVFSIFLMTPALQRFWKPKNTILKFLWGTFCVTIAAQVGLIPLVLYYFHQFPLLFIVSNMIVVPIIGVVVCFGIGVVLLSFFFGLPDAVVRFYSSIIDVLCQFMRLISQQGWAVLKSVFFDEALLIMFCVLVLLLAFSIKTRAFKTLALAMFSIIAIQLYYISKSLINKDFKSLIVFHNPKESIIGIRSFGCISIFTDDDKSPFVGRISCDYTSNELVQAIEYKPLRRIFDLGDSRILLKIDHTLDVDYKSLGLSPHGVLLSHSPKINLERLIDQISPKYIVSDGTNYKYLSRLWSSTCKKRGVFFHDTSKDGAFILNF